MKVRLRKLLPGALVLALVMAAGSASAANGDADGDAASVAATAALGDAVETLEPAARDKWPESFAGLWVDMTEEGIVESISIAFTEGAEAKVSRLGESFPEPQVLRAVTFEHSMAELEARQKEMVADRERAKKGTFDLEGVPDAEYNLDIDVEQNAIVATVEDATAQARASVKDEYGEDVRVQEGDLGGPKCVRSNCPPNLRAGLRSGLGGGGYCSMAFTVNVTGTGNRNILSAGHCGAVGTVHRHAGNPYGVVRARQYGGRVDAERIGPPYSGFFMVPRMFVTNDNTWVPVQHRSSWEGLAVGWLACKSGATTGYSCGEIEGKHFSPSWIPNGNRFIRVRNCAEGGDSGSPLFQWDHWNKAHGILSGGLPTDCPDPNQWNAYGHVEYALNALNATLVTL